ncbi:MAG TPA: inositol monophosphatase family protein [Casimicrobiaceae bacterium]|nr:inositol monophosphatase family protein [Casimicrobiaceae bacterium]
MIQPGSDVALEVGIRAARRAASVILDAARDLRRLPSHMKASDLVVQTDGEAEDAIVATVRAAFPDHAILGEESGHIPRAREGAGYKWLIDAIDGAANFAHGVPCYSVSLALARGMQLTHAIVLDPVRDEIFTAVAGKGAFCNGAPIQISACPSLEDALVASVIPARTSPLLAPYLRTFAALVPRLGEVRRSGAPGLDLAYLAAGRIDAFFSTGVAGWDLAAGVLLVHEAGGRVGDVAGSSEILRATDIVAATPALFGPLREGIAAARRPAVAD